MSRSLVAAISLPLIGATLALGLTAASHPRGRCGDTHMVVRGDTLYGIARRCRSSVAAIASASGLADPGRIEVGQLLVIPRTRGAAHRPMADHVRREAHGHGYVVARGDTLYSLARWARVGVGALIAANPGIDPRKIEIGDRIRLPAGAADPDRARQRERGPRAAAPRPEAPRAAPRPREDDDKPTDESEQEHESERGHEHESEPEPEGM